MSAQVTTTMKRMTTSEDMSLKKSNIGQEE